VQCDRLLGSHCCGLTELITLALYAWTTDRRRYFLLGMVASIAVCYGRRAGSSIFLWGGVATLIASLYLNHRALSRLLRGQATDRLPHFAISLL
jgi:hypothetical protein